MKLKDSTLKSLLSCHGSNVIGGDLLNNVYMFFYLQMVSLRFIMIKIAYI